MNLSIKINLTKFDAITLVETKFDETALYEITLHCCESRSVLWRDRHKPFRAANTSKRIKENIFECLLPFFFFPFSFSFTYSYCYVCFVERRENLSKSQLAAKFSFYVSIFLFSILPETSKGFLRMKRMEHKLDNASTNVKM
jgi:hypothetical protein